MSLEGKSPEEIEALAELAASLGANPKTRQGFLRLTKEANPNVSIPELDIPASLQAQFKEPLERLATLETQLRESQTRERITENRRAALSVKGVTEADLPAIEKLMVEKSIPDHKTAAEFHALQNKQAEPTPSAVFGNRIMGAPKLPDASAFQGNLQALGRHTAYQVIDELRGRRPAA